MKKNQRGSGLNRCGLKRFITSVRNIEIRGDWEGVLGSAQLSGLTFDLEHLSRQRSLAEFT